MKALFKICTLWLCANILTGCYSDPRDFPAECYHNEYFPGSGIVVNYPFGLYSTDNYSRAYYHPPTNDYYYDPYVHSTRYLTVIAK